MSCILCDRFDMTDKNTTDWQIENMTVGVEVSGANGSFSGNATMNTKKMNVWAPKDFSYHCSRLGPIVNVTGDNTTTINVTLTFDGLQVCVSPDGGFLCVSCSPIAVADPVAAF